MNINELARAYALTRKTYINCYYNNIPYGIKHREKIKSINDYIIDPLLAMFLLSMDYSISVSIIITRQMIDGTMGYFLSITLLKQSLHQTD